MMIDDLGGYWQEYREPRTTTELAFDRQMALMPTDDMLDDRQAEPRATDFPRACLVDAIKSFRETRQMLWCDSLTLVDDGNLNGRPPRDRPCGRRRGIEQAHDDADVLVGPTIFDRIVDEIAE